MLVRISDGLLWDVLSADALYEAMEADLKADFVEVVLAALSDDELKVEYERRFPTPEPEPEPEPDPEPDPDPQPTPVPDSSGVWISRERILSLPTHGLAWDYLVAQSKLSAKHDLKDQDSNANIQTLARALVAVRTGDLDLAAKVREDCLDAIDTENGGRTLALGRNLAAYVIAADLVGIGGDGGNWFRNWLSGVTRKNLDGRTLVSTHEERPNNWGTHAGASLAAVAAYLGDKAELDRIAQVFRGYLGDRISYAGFKYGELSWQSDPSKPVGINPKGATKEGQFIDGVMPDDMRRGGVFQWPPAETGYPWEGLQGAVVQAEILHHQGYPAWDWCDNALLRAVEFLFGLGWKAEGDDTWITHLVNCYYQMDLPTVTPSRHGKNMGFTDWTHV